MYQKTNVILIIILLLSLSISVQSAENIPFKIDYSPKDYQFGTTLSHFMSELSQNRIAQKDLIYLLSEQKKSASFSELKDTLDRINKISTINDQNSFYRDCMPSTNLLQEHSESLIEKINLDVDRYCRFLFLNRLSRFSSSINFSSRDINFLKNSAVYYTKGENQEELISFFKKFRSNSLESEKISASLYPQFIENKIRPNSQLLMQMNVSADFNKFLQNNMGLDEKASRIFQDEFQHAIKDIKSSVDKGDYSLATKLTRNSVNFYKNNKAFLNDEKVWTSITQTAKTLYFKGHEDEANELFLEAKSIAPASKMQESIYNLIWPTIITRNDNSLMTAIIKNDLEKSFLKFDSKLQYWIAYAFYKNGDQKKAFELFNKIVTTTPYSFYSILSLKILALNEPGKLNEKAVIAKLIDKSPIIDYSISKLSDEAKHSLKRLAIWQKIENEKFARSEVRFISNISKEDLFNSEDFADTVTDTQCKDFVTLNLVRLLNSKHQFLSSFKIFQESLEENSLALSFRLIKYIFPLSYLDIIKQNSRNIDPLVILSLIRQESSFNPNASSTVGAQGLMQLMPATAKRFNPRVRTKHLSNPEINIAIGVKYFKQLLTRYDGNLIFALAAYNAGESRIDRWRKEIFKTEDPLATIEAIPFEETRNYVKLIYRNYFFYSLISDKSILMTPIQDSFKVSLKR